MGSKTSFTSLLIFFMITVTICENTIYQTVSLEYVLDRIIELEEKTTKQDFTIDTLKKEIQSLKKALEASKKSIPEECREKTLSHIKKNGFWIGNNWFISQEGNVLVFRDMTTTKVRDSRFAMYMGKYRDI